jgi:uncharacterized protein HemY
VEIFARAGCPPERALALVHLGDLQARRQSYVEAEDNLREAVRIQRGTGPPSEYIRSVRRLGDLLREVGRPDEAEACLRDVRMAMERWRLAEAEP